VHLIGILPRSCLLLVRGTFLPHVDNAPIHLRQTALLADLLSTPSSLNLTTPNTHNGVPRDSLPPEALLCRWQGRRWLQLSAPSRQVAVPCGEYPRSLSLQHCNLQLCLPIAYLGHQDFAARPRFSANLLAIPSSSDCGEAILCTLRTSPTFITRTRSGEAAYSGTRNAVTRSSLLCGVTIFLTHLVDHRLWLRENSPLSSESSSPICNH
jgi:hypothetical protein